MDPAALIPSADNIPVAWGWFEVLKLVTFVCHLLLMNAVFGGAVFALLRGNSSGAGPQLAKRLPTTLALTVNLGVPPLLFVQVLYGQFLYTAAILSAVYWMLLIALVMIAYGLLYVYAGRLKSASAGPLSALALPVAVCFLLATSFILTNIMSLAIRPEGWTQYFQNPHGTILNLGDPTLFPRWLHFVFAALATGGLFTALLNFRDTGSEAAKARTIMGMKWFTHVSLIQVAVGLWWLMALPREVMLLFMGGSALHTAVFLVALGADVAVLVLGFMGRVVSATAALVLTVAVMAGMRELVRMAYLGQYFHPRNLEVTNQYGSFFVFLLSFAAGLGAIAYMLTLHRKAGGGI